MEVQRTKIIAISAISGGGKTTITTQLGQVLDNAKIIYFDEYDIEGPTDIIDWVERGYNCNEWNLEQIISDLNNYILSGNSEYILLDYPFARLHDNLKNIDLAIYIDTPLDIAMARRILRDYKNMNTEDILEELSSYIKRGRKGYEGMLNMVKPNSDLIIDGTLKVEKIIDIIKSEIERIY